jgi:GNAT superfamily N-acetyltransferase
MERRLEPPAIAPLDPAANPADTAALIELHADAVADGASVGLLAPFDPDVAAAYWRDRLAEVRAGRRAILIAQDSAQIVGAVHLVLAHDQNSAHRAEVQRLMVRRSHRGRGIGTALMGAVEAEARARGRTLLVLNTRTGDMPEALYARLGYVRAGTIPDFAHDPDGRLNTTTIMYRHLASE